jgi:hypothetical protein
MLLLPAPGMPATSTNDRLGTLRTAGPPSITVTLAERLGRLNRSAGRPGQSGAKVRLMQMIGSRIKAPEERKIVSEYSLPDLSYDYGALEPHIAGEIMQLHHSKHHQTYVTGLNSTLEQLADARAKGEFGALGGLEKSLAFNLGGHVTFWTTCPRTGAASRRANWPPRWTTHSARSTRSAPISRPTHWPSKAPGGPFWAGTPSASAR